MGELNITSLLSKRFELRDIEKIANEALIGIAELKFHSSINYSKIYIKTLQYHST